MIEKIHVDPKLEKCLTILRKGSSRACLAADRTESIITELRLGKIPPGDICAYTRNGEGRIKGCRKYDLGAGYRLVTLKQENALYLLFAGTHDECSRWIENYRDNLSLEMIAERSDTIRRCTPGKKRLQANNSPPPENDPEDDWLPELSDKELRAVFCGLVEGS